MKKVFFTAMLMLIALVSNAQVDKILGEWRTVDDKTGETKGVVSISFDDATNSYCGKTIHCYKDGKEIFDPQFVGLVIIKDMKDEKGTLKGGTVYDPESQKTYYAKISYNKKDNTITLRGSLDKAGMLGRSQTWVR